MRQAFAKHIGVLCKRDRKIVFLTGDLGFNAFENLRETIGDRFINAGVAEHNMVGVAAGLSTSGFKPWIYSIAPFTTIKVLEELRNDVCLANRNVKIVGLGGGFDYGLAGPTHHIIQDVSLMLSLPNMTVLAPGFQEDIRHIIKTANKMLSPVYIRLTKAQPLDYKIPVYKPIRRLTTGNKKTIIVFGSIIVEALCAINQIKKNSEIDLWLVSQLPIKFPDTMINSIKKTRKLIIIEEHQKHGGLGSAISDLLISRQLSLKFFRHIYITGYKSHHYGSRQFHLKENKLDSQSIFSILKKN
ncbi:hypothetical protein A3J15_03915 [Candidatus Roizmanbacteria bacterium RIFCSPLOWO2_02_FULL_38_10]|uniref:Transketolase-like pyrimidine-binding domain-containing protein n=1 Tax=Candidatus Roizmanbacteria bacterium RIFCSPLOWO2_02_FULL_38_10 TaxID=1802074 RepID=A0A1F7JM47_9BACT|nr:MAG: hypothetical protein A3J15_03915 [Candidatus Roizmanbacteria bacterium RIFCSPLOWO2_02_FULL_38_10]